MKKALHSNLLLLLAALIWGFAFVAQRKGMESIGPLTFNGIRFLLGAATVLVVIAFSSKRSLLKLPGKKLLLHGLMAGIALFIAASFQQLGILYTTAGNAGFITSLYILFVPAIGLLRRQHAPGRIWIGAIIATSGLYFLSMHGKLQMGIGDLLVLLSAVFWAMHLIVLSHIAPLHDFKWIAFLQFLFCGIFSIVPGLLLEPVSSAALASATYPILYAGIVSAGIGFTLQVAGQRHARADHAALILSLEAVFAVVGGFLILNEKMAAMQLFGCALMLAGVIISQLKQVTFFRKKETDN
jgi:drug/metabolite transporter (DMT)-like permease